MMMVRALEMLPPIAVPSPVTALTLNGDGGLWAGGVGGVAFFDGDRWHPRLAGLPLTGITALTGAGDWLFAGGAEGIARSDDGGQRWQPCVLPGQVGAVTSLAVSPHFADDGVLIAGTLQGGVFRSVDRGRTWTAANFGLQTGEILALLWQSKMLIAGTAHGIYRSPNQGLAWKLVHESDAVTALTTLDDVRLLAGLESGGLLISADHGKQWHPHAFQLPDPVEITALAGGWMGTSDGLYASSDGGDTWRRQVKGTVFSLAVDRAERAYAGIDGGIQVSRGDNSGWSPLPTAPVHDLRRVIALGGRVLVAGRFSGVMRYRDGAWQPVSNAPLPLSLLTRQHGMLYASGNEGFFRSSDGGDTWQCLWRGAAGHLSHLALQPNGVGYGSRADGSQLVRTRDGGVTWQTTPSPFGALPILTLEAADDVIFVSVYDARRRVIVLWRSNDGGNRWLPGAEVPSEWAIAAAYANPAMIALPNAVLVSPQDPNDSWVRAEFDMPDVRVRAITGDDHTQYALTLTHGVFRSQDRGRHWTHLPLDVPEDEIMDISADAGRLLALLVGGRVIMAR